jgi:hypothetical protein
MRLLYYALGLGWALLAGAAWAIVRGGAKKKNPWEG